MPGNPAGTRESAISVDGPRSVPAAPRIREYRSPSNSHGPERLSSRRSDRTIGPTKPSIGSNTERSRWYLGTDLVNDDIAVLVEITSERFGVPNIVVDPSKARATSISREEPD